jgi:alkylation response protein AidB-like acyl-CoA dehydrogenase/electron transfer flavoprotein alpha/beta subunit
VAHKLEIKLLQFDAALAEEPRTVGRDRADYLLLLARYAQQLAKLVAESLPADDHWAFAIEALALRRVKHVEAQRYSWAAADGRQLRFHHLANLRRDEGAVAERRATPAATSRDLSHRLDDILPPAVWRDLEQQKPLTPQQDAELRRLLAEVPIVDVECLGETLCAPSRRYLLVELARRDPSLAYRAAHHLWARDVAVAFGGESLAAKAGCWRRAEEWACFAVVGDAGEALMVPAVSAKSVLGLVGSSAESLVCGGFAVRPIPTLGLRGAGLARVRFDPSAAAVAKQDVTGLGVVRFAEVLGSADLIAMALGMAEYLCQRANDHAGSRVQFPGLFHDEESRDTIGKFGAVKKMIAEMAAGRQLIEALALYLGAESEATSRAALLKAVVAEVLGTAPGSIAYDAGQVFGGTGYSEDDTLSKLYRDAAAWRFLAPANSKVYIAHGAALFENWTPDGAALSAVPGEEAAFAEIAQRLALTPELRQIREHTSALSQRVTAWKFADERLPTASAQAAFREAAARLDALLLASKIVLMQTHVALEAGTAGEVEILLLRVWLGKIQVDCDEFDSLVKCLLESEGAQVKVDGPPVTSYSEFLKADLPYSSGDFLNRPIDPAAPRYVPEMIETDDVLRERNRELIDLISGQFGAPREGKIYERYLEDRHRPDEADLDFLGQHGFFRMPIPKELGGEGRSKADYYLLVVNTHRLADAAISLTVQVNSSLGSTPVLVPREKELPKARKDLAAFVQDAALHAEIAGMLEDLAKKVAPAADVLAAIQKKLDDKVLSQPVLRVACNHFVTVWQKAGRAGTQTTLSDALTAWREACGGAGEFLDELARRSEAYDLFCRWVASGQISAFALTEPSAGSDTARVATRARLRQVTVVAVPDGVYTFVPAGGKAPRRLIDGRRVVFERHANKAGGAEELLPFYRFAEAAAPAPICFDEYDYQTDACKKRYFLVDGRREYFDDVAQLREREGRLWYDYYELTGAKMWITNGRCMGIMALYAKTDEGVTGFIVDRHAEGLIVGKDEAKMGQNGSPTNELALQAVRVPRENVIGLEGRGQVNALETLNVGRAGLAMSAMCQMVRLCDWSREFARRVFGEIPAWIAWRLERLEEERFIAEAMAYEIIGRFEHKQTKSIRMESAIAKMLVSELFHHSIEIAEEVHGLAGQTQEHLVEKRKRDARILNIYEGTNEIQRFLILRELSECIVDQPAPVSGHAVDAFKHRLRQLVREAVQAFGQQLWQNPNFQANCFLLSEVAAWLTAAESTLGRFVWLTRQGTCSTEKMATGRRALMRCRQEAETRLARFATELTQLRDGRYAPAIRAATLLMQATHDSAAMTASRIDKSLSILVVLDPPMPGAPRPRVHDGKLQEAYRVFTHADRAALETALRLKEAAPELVHLQAATVGPAATAVQLREMLSLGFDRVMLVVTDEAVAPDRAAAALASARAGFADANGQQHAGPAFDLVLGGAGLADTQEGLLARLTGEVLGVPSAGSAQGIALDNGLRLIGSDGHERVRALPAAVSVEPGTALRPFTTAGWLAGLEKEVEILPLPTVLSVSPLEWEEAALAAANVSGEEAPRPLLPREATRLVLETAGIVSSSTANGSASRTDAEPPVAVDVDVPGFAAKGAIPSIVAILATDADGKLRPTARKTLEACQFVAPFIDGAPRAVLLLVPAGDACQRALTEIAALTSFDICLLTVPESAASDEVRCRLLVECWSNLETIPLAVIAEPWAESALASLATAAGSVEPIALRVRLLDRHKGRLAAEGAAVRGKLRTRQTLSSAPGHTVWIGLAADADVGAATPPAARPSRSVERWAPRLDRFFGRGDMRRLLEELKQGAGLTRLADAEFIVDVGFGVANRDGYEAVIQPLEHALRHLGVKNLMVGGSRKVTEELHLLPADRQIGQSGVSVQPRVLLAIGVSGAPQHLNYIGPRTTIVAFNRDPEAPLMTLNQRQARPRVYPVIGDLFETVPAFIACLG